MSAWIIYDKNGLAKCEARKLEYQGEFMGSCSVNVSITSPTPIGFELGDWLEYRGERFELNYDPSVVKESSSNTYGEGFQYENIVFNSLADELTRCDFLDYVLNDNEIHYSSLPTFSFFADSITKLAERIQANLDRIYTEEKKWTIEVHPEYVNTLNVNITASNNTVWDALGFVNSKFGANFIIRGRKITIGTTGLAVGQLFSYGKGNGLYKIERNAESNQKVITRLRAYGSTKNMPTDYYHNVSGGNVPNNMVVKNLMLPSFPAQTHDPYIDSKNITELGIREGTVFFDGSSELEEIYPTMEGMTAEDLKKAGVSVNAEGRLDEVVGAEQITDDGKFTPKEGEEQVTVPDFTISLKDVGFDLNDYLGTSSATISMKDGMCGGRDFEIVKCEKEGNEYKLTCHRHFDEGLDLYFPYNDYQIKGGDKFVLLNIEMPDVYIKAASQRLLNAATAYLAKNDYVRYSYSLSVDNIFMARQHDEAVKGGLISIHDIIKEGDLMLFEDEDLGIEGSITIASLNINENADESIIPQYEITLQDEKTVGTLDRIQNQIANLAANGTGGSSLNTEQIVSILKAEGAKHFLSKTRDDRSRGIIASDKGLEVGRFKSGTLGSGASMYKDEDGNTYMESDYLTIRKKAMFTTITVKELKHVGGELILSPAAMICSKVEELADGYKCYFNRKDSEGRKIFNEFEVGDQARCQTFTLEDNTYYWRLVTAIGTDFIVLSKTDCDANSDIPKEGDNISLLGNRTDASRQKAIILSAYGPDAPSYKQYKGINSYAMEDKEVTTLSPNGNRLTGIVNIEAGSTGAQNLSDLLDEIYNAVHIGSVNLLLNSGFTGDYKAEELNASYALNGGSELFSRGMKHWTGDATIGDDSVAVSGKSAVIGSLSQSVQLMKDEGYVVSFKAKGVSVKVMLGGSSVEQVLGTDYTSYSFKFVSDGVGSFSISGDATICDLQLERGTIVTDWHASPYDNDKTLAEFQALKYIQDAIREGDTSIIGGLILSSMIQLGNYKDGKMQKVNAGVNGIYNEDNDVAFWGGGTFEQAIRTIIKFKENPRYKPTESEWNKLSKYVVTHGGDIVLKGSVFADSGYFRGLVEIAEGKIRLSEDGSGSLASGGLRWDEKGILFRKWSDNIEWSGDLFNYQSGAYFDISTMFGQDPPTVELPNAPVHGYRICIALKSYIGYGSCRIVGLFSVYDVESKNLFVASTIGIYNQSASEYWLTFHKNGFWTVETDTYAIVDGVVVLGMNSKTTVGGSVIDKESVSTSKLIAAESVTVTGESESSVTTYGGVWAVGSGHFGGSVSVGDRLEVTGTSVVGYLIATNIVAVGDIESYGEVKAKTFKTGDLVGKTEDVTIKATDGTHVLKFANGLYIGDSFTANS